MNLRGCVFIRKTWKGAKKIEEKEEMERLCIYEEDVERSKEDRGEGRDEFERL